MLEYIKHKNNIEPSEVIKEKKGNKKGCEREKIYF